NTLLRKKNYREKLKAEAIKVEAIKVENNDNLAEAYEQIIDEHYPIVEEKIEKLSELANKFYTDEFIGGSLFNIHLIAMNTVENISGYVDKNKSLDGLTKETIACKEELEKSLVGIYKEYGEVLSPILNPLTQYAFINFKILGLTA